MMKNEVLYLLLDNYADYEAAFLASAIACDERGIKENPKYINKVIAPTMDAVRSCSGFQTLPAMFYYVSKLFLVSAHSSCM